MENSAKDVAVLRLFLLHNFLCPLIFFPASPGVALLSKRIRQVIGGICFLSQLKSLSSEALPTGATIRGGLCVRASFSTLMAPLMWPRNLFKIETKLLRLPKKVKLAFVAV